MRSFFSLLFTFMIIIGGNVLVLAFANNISFTAIGVMGAYYTLNKVGHALAYLGAYTYQVQRKDEDQYIQISIITGTVMGIMFGVFSIPISNVFGLEPQQKEMLASLLVIYMFALPLKTMVNMCFNILRLRGELSDYRKMVVIFYVVALSLNLVFFMTIRDVNFVLVADIAGNAFATAFFFWKCHSRPWLRFQRLDMKHMKLTARYGLPLVGENIVQQGGIVIYGILASYMSPELFAIHSVCYSAISVANIGERAYSATLMVLVPDPSKTENTRERYLSERARMLTYRRKTAWLVLGISLLAGYIGLVFMHGETNLASAAYFMMFYAVSYIPMIFSTPGKDFLVIEKKPKSVMAGTIFGLPCYIIFPLIALSMPSQYSLYIFGLAFAAQLLVRAAYYRHMIRKTDEEFDVDMREVKDESKHVVLDMIVRKEDRGEEQAARAGEKPSGTNTDKQVT